MQDKQKKPYVIDINGNKTFSADFIFEQMAAQGCRIDRIKTIAEAALFIALVAVLMATGLAAQLFL